MKVNKNLLIFFILLINTIYSQVLKCSTNLECKDSGCCKDNKCSPKSDCRMRNKLCYAFVGVGAFVVLVFILIFAAESKIYVYPSRSPTALIALLSFSCTGANSSCCFFWMSCSAVE